MKISQWNALGLQNETGMEHLHHQKSHNTDVCGTPDEMFYLPELFGFQKCGKKIESNVLSWITTRRDIHHAAIQLLNKIDEDLNVYFEHVVRVKGYAMPPRDWNEAKEIYDTIISA